MISTCVSFHVQVCVWGSDWFYQSISYGWRQCISFNFIYYSVTVSLWFCGKILSASHFLSFCRLMMRRPSSRLRSLWQNQLWRSFRFAFHSQFCFCRWFHILPLQIIRIEIYYFKHVASLSNRYYIGKDSNASVISWKEEYFKQWDIPEETE